MSVADRRIRRGDRQIASRENLVATGERIAFDDREGGERSVSQCIADAPQARDVRKEPCLEIGEERRDMFEIGTRAEIPSGTPQNDDLGIGFLGRRDNVFESQHDAFVQGVEDPRPIERSLDHARTLSYQHVADPNCFAFISAHERCLRVDGSGSQKSAIHGERLACDETCAAGH